MFNGASSQKKKERKLSIIFKHTVANQHVSGIEALAASPDSSSLYTASRDSIVRRWNVTVAKPAYEACFEGHIDWVNDVLLYQDKLVSCSSDRTVKIWSTDPEARCLHTVQHHSDYVTCLAASEAAGKLVSAGLRSEVIMYDMQTLQAHLLMPYNNSGSGSSSSSGSAAAPHRSSHDAAGDAGAAAAGSTGGAAPARILRSVYALAMNKPGSIVAAGTTESYIRLLDPRSGQKIMKLKGHTDNVRALLLNEEGTLLLSGSSDHTVRLWDLGQQRCIQTLNVHTDSVWCLAASPDFAVCYSGGRDKAVYCTHMGLRKAWLITREEQPVRSIAVADGGSKLWVATTSASVNGYNIPAEFSNPQQQQQQQARQQSHPHPQQHHPHPQQMQHAASGGGISSSSAGGAAAAAAAGAGGSSAGGVAASIAGLGGGAAPQAGRGVGHSGSGRHHLLGSSPTVRLRHSYDPGTTAELPLLTPAVCIEGSPGLVALRVLNDKRHILTQDSQGEVQLWDVLAGRPIQQLGKVDLAEAERCQFRVLFVEPWFLADVKLGSLAVNLEPPKCFAAEAYALDLGLRDVPDDQKVNLGACLLRSALAKWAHNFSSLFMSGVPLPGLDDPGADQMPHFSSELPPSVVSTSAAGVAWRLSSDAFTGREREGDDLPPWACEAVLRANLPYVKELKAAFVLHPAEGSGLPSLLQSRLNAPRILQVMKVANYCVTKLAELNVPLATLEVGLRPESQLPPPNTGQQYLELTCNGVAVPYTLSISTVKKFIWKRSDDVVFHYRVLDPARPAPFPTFGMDT